MAPITINRVVIVSLFLPYTVSFQIDKEKDVKYESNVNLTSPKPNLIEGLAAQRTKNLKTPQKPEDVDKLFPGREDDTAPPATLMHPRSRALHSNTGNSKRMSTDCLKLFAEAPWTVEPCPNGNIGLQNAIKSISDRLPYLMWVGTLGMFTDTLTDEKKEDIGTKLAKEHNAIPVFVPDAEFDGHYDKFCKQVLWPTFHYVLPDDPKSRVYEDDSWKHYVTLNQRFADTIAEHYQPGDIIWINDYHLLLVPEMLRKKLPNAMIGFFLHLPFPSSEIFRCLFVRKQLLEGVLGADLIGFQTYSFARHFIQTCSRILSLEATPKGIQLENNFVSVGIFPIGIDIQALNEKRKDSEVLKWTQLLKEKYAGKKLVVARDKLDYVKGVRHKMLAFERFLTNYPQWQGKVVLIQVALSTTDQNETQSQVSDVVSSINSKFSNLAYQPVNYLHKDITFSQYLALLTTADVCLITSLRDGMNLTSHEYVVCQEETRRPLILSEFAGTYGSFGAAIRTNPWDYRETADAIHEALTISDEDATTRWKELFKTVTTHSAQFWAQSFVTELEKVHGDMQRRFSIHIPHFNPKSFEDTFHKAEKRLILLDYDGTLVPYEKANVSGRPPQEYVKIMKKLCSNLKNQVYVMSSRSRQSLDERLGDIPNLGLSAENGAFIKPIGGNWEGLISDIDTGWREQVQEIFGYFAERVPGSYIETKDVSIVWHYRSADNQSYGAWQAAECQNHIEDALGTIYPIHVVAGNKKLEVMPCNVNKAIAISRILLAGVPDFILAIGDDRTDEDMFNYVNKLEDVKTTITCTVGSKSSEASYFISGVMGVVTCLDILASEGT